MTASNISQPGGPDRSPLGWREALVSISKESWSNRVEYTSLSLGYVHK